MLNFFQQFIPIIIHGEGYRIRLDTNFHATEGSQIALVDAIKSLKESSFNFHHGRLFVGCDDQTIGMDEDDSY